MNDPFAIAEQYLPHDLEPAVGGVEICSSVLEAHIWLALNPDFDPADGQAVFYPEELPILATKSADELRGIHKSKLIWPGSRVRQ